MQHGADIVACHGLEDILFVGSAEIRLGTATEYPNNDAVASQEILTQGESIGESACIIFAQRRCRRNGQDVIKEGGCGRIWNRGRGRVTVRENFEQ